MTIDEAAKTYDVIICYHSEDEDGPSGWWWEVSSGYCVTGSDYFEDINNCVEDLYNWLITFTGYDK